MSEHQSQGLRRAADFEVESHEAGPQPADTPEAWTRTRSHLVEAVRSLGFSAAAEEVFRAFQDKDSLSSTRQLVLNPFGGVHEIADASSMYRKSVKRQGRLSVLWLCSALGMCAVNAYELTAPNVLELQELLKMENVMEQTDLAKAMSFVMAFYELIGTGFLFAGIICCIFASQLRTGFMRWRSLSDLAWVWLPTLTRFSAIKMLGLCHPKTVFADLQDLLEAHGLETEEESLCGFLTSRQMCVAVRMVLWKLLVLIAGLAALCIKSQKVSAMLAEQETSFWMVSLQVLGVLGFLNQCINIVDVAGLLKVEALRFAFAGEDATYQRKELIYKAVFAACVAKGIFENVGKTRGRLHAFAALYTFDHKDVQRLAVGSEGFCVNRCLVRPPRAPKTSPV